MPKERILVIGKASPQWSEKKRDLLICTAGVTKNFEWRRLYPIFIGDLDKIHNFSWIEAKVTKKLPDPRPESRKLLRELPDCLKEVGKIEDVSVRKWYVEKCAQPSIEGMRRERKTLGIVKPVIKGVEITAHPKKAKNDIDDVQSSLTRWAPHPFLARRVAEERWKKQYAERDFVVRFRFICGPECEHEHNMSVLDIELFMLYQHLYRRYRDRSIVFEKMYEAIEKVHSRNDVYFGVGTHLSYPFLRYMVGSVMRFKKGILMTKPLGGDF